MEDSFESLYTNSLFFKFIFSLSFPGGLFIERIFLGYN